MEAERDGAKQKRNSCRMPSMAKSEKEFSRFFRGSRL